MCLYEFKHPEAQYTNFSSLRRGGSELSDAFAPSAASAVSNEYVPLSRQSTLSG